MNKEKKVVYTVFRTYEEDDRVKVILHKKRQGYLSLSFSKTKFHKNFEDGIAEGQKAELDMSPDGVINSMVVANKILFNPAVNQ